MEREQLPVTRRVVRNMITLRKEMKLSTNDLAGLVRELGVPMTRSVLANLEAGRRDAVTVDELYALAEVLSTTPEYLAASHGVRCSRCEDKPPAGYACMACGAVGDEARMRPEHGSSERSRRSGPLE